MALHKIQHPLNAGDRALTNGLWHHNLWRLTLQALNQILQGVHGHPGAMCAALASGTLAGRWSLHEDFVASQLSHAMHQTVVSGHDVFTRTALDHCLQQLRRGAHHIGLSDD